MRLDVYVHSADHKHDDVLCKILEQLTHLNFKFQAMAKTTEEVLTELAAISITVKKIGGETSASLTKIAELQAAVDAAGGVPQPVQDAIDALATQLQAVDDLVPDAPTA